MRIVSEGRAQREARRRDEGEREGCGRSNETVRRADITHVADGRYGERFKPKVLRIDRQPRDRPVGALGVCTLLCCDRRSGVDLELRIAHHNGCVQYGPQL
jgi:hypothetical protein